METKLEPRVAKLETGLEILTKDVRDLVNVVREQSSNLDGELQKLAVAVTNAAAPRKTDWATLISLAFLILALGSAVFYPLSSQVQDLKAYQAKIEQISRDDNDRQDRLFDVRLNKVESNDLERNKADLEELRAWRNKASGLSSPGHTVPLIGKDLGK